MPWWSWVLIWTGLVVLLLAVLVLGALHLWRKAAAALDELDRLQRLEHEFDDLVRGRVTPFVPATPALLRPFATVLDERNSVAEAREERREARRQARIERGRALTHADPMQYAHLADLRHTTQH